MLREVSKGVIAIPAARNKGHTVSRAERLEVLRKIIQTREISNHAQLVRELGRRGIEVTQATVSRDLHMLGVEKTSGGGEGSVYRQAPKQCAGSDEERMLLSGAFITGIDGTGNLVLVHTVDGYAAGIACLLDNRKLPGVLGTVSGDDTVLLVLRNAAARPAVERILGALMRPQV